MLSRFAAPRDAWTQPVMADVRLGHEAGDLLIRVDPLPDGVSVEVLLEPDEKDVGPGKRAGLVEGGSRVLVVGAGDLLIPGALRSARIQLVDKRDPSVTYVLPWAPSGDGDLTTPFPILVTDREPAEHPVNVDWEDGRVDVTAPGAGLTSLTYEWIVPSADRGAPEAPWTASGVDRIDGAQPADPGWYTIEGRWADDLGRLTDLVRWRAWLEPQPADAPSFRDIQPVPKLALELAGEPLPLDRSARICLAEDAFERPAELLRSELERFTGIGMEIANCDPSRTDIWVGREPGRKLRRRVADEELLTAIEGRDEAFYLQWTEQGGLLVAADLRGAVYGALALADSLGRRGAQRPYAAADWPDIKTRVLFHRIDNSHPKPLDIDLYVRFLERAVARGRYNQLVLMLRGGYRYQSHPGLAKSNALNREQLLTILDAARGLGIEVVPGADSPGHADWLTAGYPRLKEDRNNQLACTRNPELYVILGEVYDELIELFDHPRYFHIGHDEVLWRTDRIGGDERCPRCAGTPRWKLYADDLKWNLEFFAARGIRPQMWHDMLVPGHFGDAMGTTRALELLPEELRKQVIVMAWAGLGDAVAYLSDAGFEVQRVHTAYWDSKRGGLIEQADRINGEGLALFYPTPWSLFGSVVGLRVQAYSWASTVLAGHTAWRMDLTRTTIATTLHTLAESPAFMPGVELPLGWTGAQAPLVLQGRPVTSAVPAAVLPKRAEVGQLAFEVDDARGASRDAPVVIEVGRQVRGVALLQGTALTWEAEDLLRRDVALGDSWEGRPVAELQVTWADGQAASEPLFYGMHTWRVDAHPRAVSLWSSAGSLTASSPEAAGSGERARDRTLYALLWTNPRPAVAVDNVRVVTDREGVEVEVAAATGLLPADASAPH